MARPGRYRMFEPKYRIRVIYLHKIDENIRGNPSLPPGETGVSSHITSDYTVMYLFFFFCCGPLCSRFDMAFLFCS